MESRMILLNSVVFNDLEWPIHAVIRRLMSQKWYKVDRHTRVDQ